MTLYVAPIVEGQTETKCVERLLWRVWLEIVTAPDRLHILRPYRGPRDALVHPNGLALTQMVQKAFLELRSASRHDGEARRLVLVLLDAERDLPCELAPRLLQTARAARSDADIACVLPRRMLENWFVAAALSLSG